MSDKERQRKKIMLRVPPELYDKIRNNAFIANRSMNQYLIDIITTHFWENELGNSNTTTSEQEEDPQDNQHC